MFFLEGEWKKNTFDGFKGPPRKGSSFTMSTFLFRRWFGVYPSKRMFFFLLRRGLGSETRAYMGL